MTGDDTLAALRRGELAGARTLTLRADLDALPSELFALADTLEVLDVGGNRLTALPPQFAELRALRVLFASGNRFDVLPPVLGALPELSQLGVRGCGIAHIPPEALPPQLRWLTLTDNALTVLPEALGERPRLQKLMLAGNRLRSPPRSLEGARNLELLRLSANAMDVLPPWLAELPALAWLAWAANPFEAARTPAAERIIPVCELVIGAPLGEGASGRVHEASWRPPGEPERPVAVKLFKGAMTSDGLPEHEMTACLAAGAHPALAGALGRLGGGPEAGLVMPRLPADWRVLADPPDVRTCSRDVYRPGPPFRLDAALRIASDVAEATAHLHARGLMHGDLYAHNVLWDGIAGRSVLTDFGAASFLPCTGPDWTRLEVLAFGRLLAELAARVDEAPSELDTLARDCLARRPQDRPTMADVADRLHRAMPSGC